MLLSDLWELLGSCVIPLGYLRRLSTGQGVSLNKPSGALMLICRYVLSTRKHGLKMPMNGTPCHFLVPLTAQYIYQRSRFPVCSSFTFLYHIKVEVNRNLHPRILRSWQTLHQNMLLSQVSLFMTKCLGLQSTARSQFAQCQLTRFGRPKTEQRFIH